MRWVILRILQYFYIRPNAEIRNQSQSHALNLDRTLTSSKKGQSMANMSQIKISLIVLVAMLASATVQSSEIKLPTETTAALAHGSLPAPWGWRDFCRKNPADCVATAINSDRLKLTTDIWRKIIDINNRVNQSIEPVSDLDHWGKPESWDYPSDGKGDCEDYALLKRGLLIRSGLPSSSLLLTVVINRRQEGHAVLMVTTDLGDFVLDNQSNQIQSWDATGYRFVERQSATNPNEWVQLNDGMGEVLVSSRDKKTPFD